jgi:hypothetical protein
MRWERAQEGRGMGEGKGRREGKGKYRKFPSVRTLRSCRTNQIPLLSSGSVRRKALADKLPIKFLVNMPVAAGIGAVSDILFMLGSGALYICVLKDLNISDSFDIRVRTLQLCASLLSWRELDHGCVVAVVGDSTIDFVPPAYPACKMDSAVDSNN